MTRFLITNDDGIDSPALGPLARALGRLGDVTVAAPSGERSWIGKAITKVGNVHVAPVERDGITMWSVDGYPADCVHIGCYGVLEAPPDLVVSGINIGSNKGSAFATGSGTLGATVEAANLDLAGIAFSAMSVGVWEEWVRWVYTEPAREMWERLADVAVDIVETVLATGIPSTVDVLSVNLPEHADLTTGRVVTRLARTKYGPLFAGDNGTYAHAFDGILHTSGDLEGSDLQILDEGLISITPIRYVDTASLSDATRAMWEKHA